MKWLNKHPKSLLVRNFTFVSSREFWLSKDKAQLSGCKIPSWEAALAADFPSTFLLSVIAFCFYSKRKKQRAMGTSTASSSWTSALGTAFLMKLWQLADSSKRSLESAQLEPLADSLWSQKLRFGLYFKLEHIELRPSAHSSKWLIVSFNLE